MLLPAGKALPPPRLPSHPARRDDSLEFRARPGELRLIRGPTEMNDGDDRKYDRDTKREEQPHEHPQTAFPTENKGGCPREEPGYAQETRQLRDHQRPVGAEGALNLGEYVCESAHDVEVKWHPEGILGRMKARIPSSAG